MKLLFKGSLNHVGTIVSLLAVWDLLLNLRGLVLVHRIEEIKHLGFYSCLRQIFIQLIVADHKAVWVEYF